MRIYTAPPLQLLTALVLVVSAASAAAPAHAQSEAFAEVIECVLFLGGRPSQTRALSVDERGHGGGSLYFDSNQFRAAIKAEATPASIEIELEIERHSWGGGDTDIISDFSRGRASNSPGQTLGSVSVTNGRIACHTR